MSDNPSWNASHSRHIPNEEVQDLPLGTRLLVHCLDEPGGWLECILKMHDRGLYLYDVATDGNLTDVEDLDRFCEIYEYNAEDAKRLIKINYQVEADPRKNVRYVFDKEEMVIWDVEKNHIVCLVDTKRPDLMDKKVGELISLANIGARAEDKGE